MAANDARDAKVGNAIAAAQDPESTTTADDAQRQMVAESRNAGIPAFTFDPDATPEQKRAQARDVRLPGYPPNCLALLLCPSSPLLTKSAFLRPFLKSFAKDAPKDPSPSSLTWTMALVP